MDSRKIDQEDIITTKGMDAFDHPGERERKTLALKKQKRDAFFDAHPGLKEYLSDYPKNPPIEEGDYETLEKRDREGEYFITTAGARVLVDKMVNEHVTKPGGKPYNTENLFVIDDDTKILNGTIAKWAKRDDIDAKITYVNNCHHISLYLRKVKGKTRCLILDSQPGREISSVINAVRQAIPDADITRSMTPLQLDFFSCPVFALKAMRFFAKYGDQVFSHIDKCTLIPNKELGCNELQPLDLMPTLMKMMQKRMDLPEQLLKQVVSHRKNMTLGDYLAKYQIERDGKIYNASAVIKRYEYQSLLHGYLFKQNQEQESGETEEHKRCCITQ